jgi:hypothetical protein
MFRLWKSGFQIFRGPIGNRRRYFFEIETVQYMCFGYQENSGFLAASG